MELIQVSQKRCVDKRLVILYETRKVLQFSAHWMELESVILKRVRKTKTNITLFHSVMEYKDTKQEIKKILWMKSTLKITKNWFVGVKIMRGKELWDSSVNIQAPCYSMT